ncbi:alpha/beta hydrolase family protein [Nostocoides vanveenii]|uniref:Alpha/beta fold hydrolase n=1 Tax=Nostocoides vanveenii TaxID=330835 RepID=A0ABN2KGM5_9MICO
MSSKATAKRAAIGAAAVSSSAAAGAAGAALGAAAYFARRVLTPDRRKPDDCEVLSTATDSVVLAANAETVVPGRYGLWLDGSRGHIRIGEILDRDEATVRRRIEAQDFGIIRPGPARWNGYYYCSPPEISLGLATRHVEIVTDLGPMPAWLIPGMGDGSRWAILVHGRGARREETIRAIPPVLAARHTVLVPSYRNDEGAPPGPDGRYNLGLSEWRDIESAIAYAVAEGARDVTLVGWSMGGAIVLQVLAQSALASAVTRVVLDGPVVDWTNVLAHHARAHGVPSPVGDLSRTIMGKKWSRRLVGVHDTVDVAQTNWVARAAELHHPILLIHSIDDEFVPAGPSLALAEARPDLVTVVHWELARHCKEWNTDPARWEYAVSDFLKA